MSDVSEETARLTGVLLRPLPYREPERLVRLWETNLARGGALEMTSISNLLDWRNQNRACLQAIGRLKSEVTLDQAQAEMDGIAAELARQFPNSNRGRGIKLVSLTEQTVGSVRRAILIVFGAGLMIRSLNALWNVDPGFRPDNVLTFGLNLPPSISAGQTASPDAIRAALRELRSLFTSVYGLIERG